MSVGTIVTIVLLMSVLVLGIFLIKNIFSSSKNAIDLTDKQLTSEIEKLFSEESRLVIYPTSMLLKLKQEEAGAVGLGIKNLATSAGQGDTFSYEVVASENNCGLSNSEIEEWIILGKSEENIQITIGEMEVARVTFQIPSGTPLCSARFRVNVYVEGDSYDTESFDVQVKAK